MKKITWATVVASISHYKKVWEQFGDDDLSPEYFAAIGDTPNFTIKDGKVYEYGIGGIMHEVEIIGSQSGDRMLKITVTKANEEQKLVTGGRCWERGIHSYDDTDGECHFFCGLAEGDWIVEIEDKGCVLSLQQPGKFVVKVCEDMGYYKEIKHV